MTTTSTPKNMQLKHKGWHDVILDGDLLTGDTYCVKEWIKKYLNGRWDSNRRGWVVDLEAVQRHTYGNTITSK